jgi:hypothetical protein
MPEKPQIADTEGGVADPKQRLFPPETCAWKKLL